MAPTTHLHYAFCWVIPQWIRDTFTAVKASSLSPRAGPSPQVQRPPLPCSGEEPPASCGRRAHDAARTGGARRGECIKTTHTLYSQPPLLDQPDKWVKGIGLSH